MKCSSFKKRISQYLDKELSPEEEKRFVEHRETCEKCNGLILEYEGLDKILGEIPVVHPPGPRTSFNAAHENRKAGIFFLAKALAGALVVILVAFILFRFGSDGEKNRIALIPPGDKRTVCSYEIKLNQRRFNLNLKGDGVQLLNFEIAEGEDHISLSFSEGGTL